MWNFRVLAIALFCVAELAGQGVYQNQKKLIATFTNFNQYVASRKDSTVSLQIGSNWYVTGKCTLGVNIDLYGVTRNARIYGLNGSAVDTLFIKRQTATPMHQVFDSSLVAVYMPGSVNRVSVAWFGTNPDSASDDTKAIQRAVNSVTKFGGVVHFPTPGIYSIGSEVTVYGKYPVSIVSDMQVSLDAFPLSYIGLRQTIAGNMFKVRNNGFRMEGLWFRNPASVVGGTRGAQTVAAVVQLDTCSYGVISRCFFDGIAGVSVEVKKSIGQLISNCLFRDCGTGTGSPAIYLNGPSIPSTEETRIDNCTFKTCRGRNISMRSSSKMCQVSGCVFTGDSAISTTLEYFVYNLGNTNTVARCTFEKNSNSHVFFAGVGGGVSWCNFIAPYWVSGSPQIVLSGSFKTVLGCNIYGNYNGINKGTAINDIGGSNTFTGCNLYQCGGVELALKSTWSGGGLYDLKTTNECCIIGVAYNSITGTIIEFADSSGGIWIDNYGVASGNSIQGNYGIGIYSTSQENTVVGNTVKGNIGGDIVFTAVPVGYSPNANSVTYGTTPPLQYQVAYDPPKLTVGGSVGVIATITGVQIGDVATAQFPAIAGGIIYSGIVVTATVVANNTVKASITNNASWDLDLDNNLLVIKVVKK